MEERGRYRDMDGWTDREMEKETGMDGWMDRQTKGARETLRDTEIGWGGGGEEGDTGIWKERGRHGGI